MPKRKPKRPPPSQRMQGKQVSGFISQADYATITKAATAAGLSPWLYIRAAAIEKAQGDVK